MVGLGGSLDTPRTNAGDATYLERPPDFDVSQEMSFQSPTKDGNIFDQMRNGGKPNLRTPRGGSGARAPFSNRQNLPEGIGGVEFTPLLKSATRNSARRGYRGKENGAAGAVPFSLGKIDEDDTTIPVPGAMDLSSFGVSRNMSYVESTPLPHIDSSSIASTPIAIRPRGDNKDNGGPLQDGNQLSLREQENVIDRIEKENFGLKLKIHFLEEALRKAGPGFSDEALKENTELKVDKVTLQRELQRCKKLLISAEQNLETYRQEMLSMQEKIEVRQADEVLHAELERLRDELAAKDADIEELQRKVDEQSENAREEIEDLEADLREKDRIISQKEEELEDFQVSMEARMEENRERIAELEEKANSSDKLDEAKETIDDLEADIRRLEQQVDDMKDKLDEAVTERKRAEEDLEELQEEMANKSVHTKGLSRQVEEKVARLQGEVDKSQREFSQLEEKHEEQQREAEDLKLKLKEARVARDTAEREALAATSQLKEAHADLNMTRDQKTLLQTRHDTLANESAILQRDVSRLQKAVAQLEGDLELERQHSSEVEQDLGVQVKAEMERLNKHIIDLQTEISEKEHLYDIDSEKWDTDREHLESERNRLQQTINQLRETEGALSGKEAQLQELMDSERMRHESEENILRHQLENLQTQLDTRQGTLDGLRKELASVRDELRSSQLTGQASKNKCERLEDEVEALQRSHKREAEQARHEKDVAEEERDSLRKQLAALRTSGASASSATNAVTALQESAASTAQQHREQIDRMRAQITESATNVARITKEKQGLQDQLANINIELHSLRASLSEMKAERDEIQEQLRRSQQHDGDTFRVDQERIDLRTTKMELDSEVRRLREENKSLAEQCQSLETTLEEELEKAANEEERLGQEVRHLQSLRLRSSTTESQELQAARRTIRDLERRIEDYEVAAATAAVLPPSANAADVDDTNTGELSLMRRDLSAARAKEREYLQREATHKEAVKSMRRQIADLERAAHEADLKRLMVSSESTEDVGSIMSPSSSAARKAEIVQLREQVLAAHQSVADMKQTLRESERHAESSAATAKELEMRIGEVEEERVILEQALDEAQEAMAEAASAHEMALRRVQAKLERYRHERDELALALEDAQHNKAGSDSESVSSEMSREERSNLHAMLRKTQVEAEALEHDLRDHRTALDEAVRSEEALRAKLERVRGERAAFRADVERLQREVNDLQETSSKTRAAMHYGTNSDAPTNTRELVLAAASAGQHNGNADTDALVRASEEQSNRHRKELRGLGMQIDWMQARWEREARLRCGAVLGKQLVSQDLEMRINCNKADLQMLQGILQQLGVKQPVLQSASIDLAAGGKGLVTKSARKTLRRVVLAVQFMVRTQRAASAWSQHEATRQRLATAAEGVRKAERMQQMRAAWRVQLATAASSGTRQ
ncbi:spindle-pole body protein (Pcp1) [Sporothrix schenckii 1099-18]|uniref:Spindle-pole body protein (Pcp1) n=1 Tax=Sporothrix schenckii 1099-18 TaxID=1397361 RepID=A0A0F2LU75_SPOSC|nr:spindle-pole body protein (Pcp1) [Sporothrix schenckii 1099-18]KJR80060.1 spindle-pole body protein (Pcp1) [Sporothrix schenckii 1099-18]